MTGLIRAAIRERKVTILLSLVLLGFGVATYFQLPRQENPDTSSPAAQIVTVYPGASARDVESLITKPVEDVAATLDGIDFIRSYSYDDLSVVIVMLNYDVDYREQWDTLRTGLDTLTDVLPYGAMTPEVDTRLTESAGVILAVKGEDYSLEQLNRHALNIKDRLTGVEGIRKIDVLGEPGRELLVLADPESLGNYGLSLEDLYNILQAQSVVIPPGSLRTGQDKLGVRIPSLADSAGAVEDLVITASPETGAVVRLREVARTSFSYVETDTTYRHNGQEAVLISLYFKEGQNMVTAGQEIRRILSGLEERMPEGISVEEVTFLPEDVSRAVDGFALNLLQGMALVVLVVLAGMGRKNALVVSLSIPLSVAVTLVAMDLMGVELQQVSIAALILSLGILVDNSIVIADAVQVKLNQGLPPREAALEGVREQMIPVLSSTLTTVAAFAPLTVLPGEAGEFVKTLPQVVITALSASYLVAILVVPAMASRLFHPAPPGRDRLHRVREGYQRLLSGSLNRPVRSLVLVALSLAVVLSGSVFLSVRMFPYVDKDLIYINLQSETGGDIRKTSGLLTRVEQLLAEEPEIISVTSALGGGLPRFYMTASFVSPAEEQAQVLCRFQLDRQSRFSRREDLALHLQEVLDRGLTGGQATVNLLEINIPGPDLDVRISGGVPEDVEQVAAQLYRELAAMPGTLDVRNDQGRQRYQYTLQVDRDLSATYGLSAYDIQNQANLALRGRQAGVIHTENDVTGIRLRADIEDTAGLMALPVRASGSGQLVPLRQVASLELTGRPGAITRYNRQPMVSVTARVHPEFGVSTLQKAVENTLAGLDTRGLSIAYGGDQETISKYLTGLIGAGLAALVAVYVILLIQFNSLRQPLIVMAAIPLSFMGVVPALLVTGTRFTFTVGLGVASLSGIVVNNAILLIEHMNRTRREGMELKAACQEAVRLRTRPIFLTTITTITGLIPLMFSGNSFFAPLAIALTGGLTVSTIMTLVVVPTIYYLMQGAAGSEEV